MIEFKLQINKVSGLGKNNYGITRSGIHYPRKSFKIFKNKLLPQILAVKFKQRIDIINKPCKLILYYYPKDNYKRDATAVLDAIFNILETAGIISDDNLIKEIEYKELRQPSDYTFHIILLKSIIINV